MHCHISYESIVTVESVSSLLPISDYCQSDVEMCGSSTFWYSVYGQWYVYYAITPICFTMLVTMT